MKHYLDLIPISTKINHKQNKMSIFCIILAVFLVTTIFGMADMFIRSQILQVKLEIGEWHMTLRDVSKEDIQLIALRPEVEVVTPYDQVNYQEDQDYTINGKNVIVGGSEEALFSHIFTDMLYEGCFPQSDKEAIITKNARDRMNLQIGDAITIQTPNGPLSFVLSGFLKNTPKLLGSDAYGVFVTSHMFQTIDPTNEGNLYYLKFNKTNHIQKQIADLKSDFDLSDEQIGENTKLVGLLGQSANSFMIQIYIVALVLFVLVMLAGIIMIASSLNSNIAQRIQFFGLMRCIGATPKQVMRLVYKEALSWCRFAIPAGVLLGIVIIWILCALLRYLSPQYFSAMPLLSISLPSILAGVMIGLLTVLLAARSPAKKASKVSPLTAVSGNAYELQAVRKATNTKHRKIETALGIHHAKANRKNFVLMTLSFALSIILFLSFSVTIDFMKQAMRPMRPWAPDISIVSTDKTCSVPRATIEQLKTNPIVDKVFGRMFAYDVPIHINNVTQTVDFISYEQHQFEWAKKYLLAGSLQTAQKELNTGLIVYDSLNTIQVGDTVTLANGQTIQIVGMLSDCPFDSTSEAGIIICSEATLQNITGQTNYTVIDMQLKKKATDEDVNAIHDTYGVGYTFIDKRMDNSSIRGSYYCMWLFLYGFLALIALITVFNIINSIALSVTARSTQYGVFRAIGLSHRQLSKMVIAEAFTYAIVGSILGIFIGLVCNKFCFTMLLTRQWGNPWHLPLAELCIIVLLILASVTIAVYRPIKKLYQISIVDISKEY